MAKIQKYLITKSLLFVALISTVLFFLINTFNPSLLYVTIFNTSIAAYLIWGIFNGAFMALVLFLIEKSK